MEMPAKITNRNIVPQPIMPNIEGKILYSDASVSLAKTIHNKMLRIALIINKIINITSNIFINFIFFPLYYYSFNVKICQYFFIQNVDFMFSYKYVDIYLKEIERYRRAL